jgi:cation transport ATPase
LLVDSDSYDQVPDAGASPGRKAKWDAARIDDAATICAPTGPIIEDVDVDLLEVGNVVRIPSGASPPADRIVVSGDNAAFDESSLAAASRLVRKCVGDEVFLGSVNKSGAVSVKILKAKRGSTCVA